MGYSSWKSEDWSSYTSSRGYTPTSTASDLYTSSTVKKEFEPKGIEMRESCDSEEHPNSTPIVLGLDVTGSMSGVLESVSKGIDTVMGEIYEREPVKDPQICFMAFGDTEFDSHPLQVTQFESDIRIAEQLNDIYFERGGGGNDGESYMLPWYFAARHTKLDSWEKHGKKGVLFTMGDEECLPFISASHIKKFIGDDIQADLTSEQILTEVSRQYEVYHLLIEEGSGMRWNPEEVRDSWQKLLGQRAIPVSDVTKLPEIIVSILEVLGGKDTEAVAASWDGSTSVVVRKAISGLAETKGGGDLVEF